MEAMMSDANVLAVSRDQRGFALPAAIFALVVVALLVTSGFFISGQERSIGQSTEFASQATLLAETGMNEVLATWSPDGGGPNLGEGPIGTCAACTGGVSSLNGEWQVAISRVGEKIYFVESTGTVNQAGRLSGATRTVGTLARLLTVDFSADAALTTRGDVETRGGASISGFDVNPPGAVCTGDTEDKAGVITTPGSSVTQVGTSKVEGDPRDERRDFDPSDTFRLGDLGWDELVAMADIRLPGGNINQTYPRFDANDKCDKSHELNWGDPERIVANPDCRNYYPIIHVEGLARIQSGGRGQGILLIEGDLDLRGDFLFQGIVMVRGQVGVQGAGNRVYGSLLAANGLEIDPDLSTFVGASVVQYSSCAISNVINNLSGLNALRPIQNRSWVDLTAVGF
jgi:hypothetical protein